MTWYRYYAYGVAALLACALWRGWAWTDFDEVRNVPKSVRDNPGVYRSHYASYSRYRGGK